MRRLTRTWALLVALGFVAGFVQADDKKEPGKQQEKHLEKEVLVKVTLDYLLYLPDGYDDKEAKEWPLLVFLHGLGESGNDLKKVKIHGPPKLVEAGKSFPFIVVSPQNSRPPTWDVTALNALVDEIVAKYKVDKDRVYLTGLSMGGYGTWALATAHPEKFAAIAPICGGGNPAEAKKLKDLPIWVFHGAKDGTVLPARSEAMVKALKEAGAENVKFTLYPNANHDSWTETYDNPELYDWFLKQKRPSAKKE